jgi:glycine cleavage system H protein
MLIPDNLLYSSDHEWVEIREDRVRIGITDYAQDALGDIVYAQLPEVGATFSTGEALGELESTKSVSEVYAPLSGQICAVNDVLSAMPEEMNQDPYENGWMCEMVPNDMSDTEHLDAAGYRELIEH